MYKLGYFKIFPEILSVPEHRTGIQQTSFILKGNVRWRIYSSSPHSSSDVGLAVTH